MVSVMPKQFDVIVIGAAAAGLTAGLYAARQGLKTAIISPEIGGQMLITGQIENYPAIFSISGPQLASIMASQSATQGANFISDRVIGLQPQDKNFIITTTTKQYQTKAVILAFGLSPRALPLTQADNWLGKGLSYGRNHQTENYRGRQIVIVGGGSAAVQTALELSSVAKAVKIIHRKDRLTAEQFLLDKLADKNISVVLQAEVAKLAGSDVLQKITLTSGDVVDVDDLIIAIGYESKTDWLNGLVEINPAGQIVIDQYCATSCPGIFAAGDCTTLPYKQLVISAGEGAKAALSAAKYLKGQDMIRADWATT